MQQFKETTEECLTQTRLKLQGENLMKTPQNSSELASCEQGRLMIVETERDKQTLKHYNPDHVREKCLDPKMESRLLHSRISLSAMFDSKTSAIKWLFAELKACQDMANVQVVQANVISAYAKSIYAKYSSASFCHFCLFFAYAQIQQLWFPPQASETEIESFGSYNIGNLVNHLGKHLYRAHQRARTDEILAEEQRKREQYRADIKSGKCIGWSEYVNSLSEQEKDTEAFKNAKRLVETFHLDR